MNNKITNKEKYMACIILHALGDTIGYNNSKWEFMKNTISYEGKVMNKLFEYINYGGVKYVPQKNWNISDDTIMHIGTIKNLLKQNKNIKEYGKNLKEIYINIFDTYFNNKENINKRMPGTGTINSLIKLKEGIEWDNIPYDFNLGGSGAAMRTSCIGLVYNGIENRKKLIKYSIETSRILHNSPIGYLGGLVASLFTAYAIEGIEINKWGYLLMELFEKKIINKYIEESGRDIQEYNNDSHIFIAKWNRYLNDKFDDNGNIIKRRSDINLLHRTNYYINNFAYINDKNNKNKKPSTTFVGGSGYDSVIIAYDCLLDAKNKWEKLLIYSMLHAGDTDTTGCIAASWYGALYGFGDVPRNRIEIIENINEIKDLSIKLYNKYNIKN